MAGCGVPRYVRANRAALARPALSAAETTNGRTASMIYAARTGAGVVVVDLGWARAGRALDRALGELGATRADVAAVLLTHSHRDHVGAWRAVRGAPVYLGAAEAPLLFGERPHAGWAAHAADVLVAPRLPRRGELRVVPVAGDTTLVFGADTVRGFATPGHTAGSMSWLVRDVLFIGDAASAHVRGGGLRAARRGYAGSVAESRRSLARVRRAVAPYRVRLVCTAHARCQAPTPEVWRALGADAAGGGSARRPRGPGVAPRAVPSPPAMPDDLRYVLLLFALFVVPRVLQRYRLPAAITSFLLGAVVAFSGAEVLPHDATLPLMATFGIAAMFLVAGLEVNVDELRRGARVIAEHLAIRAAVLLAVGFAAHALLPVGGRAAALVALALLTPSTGFILDSLPGLGVGEAERFWIRAKAIATELLALAVLFVTLQTTSAGRFALATAALVAMATVLPYAFRLFAARVAPYAPRSEFAFLLMLAVVAAYVTKQLGVYYLVGAFLVGAAAQFFRERLPALSSESLVHAVEAFASVFAPFYFFYAGLRLRAEDFSPAAVGLGVLLFATVVPLRVWLVVAHRRRALGQPPREGVPVALALTPTLVFSLVLAGILRDRFGAPPYLIGALIVYTVLNTLVPGFALRGRAPELDVLQPEGADPHRPRPDPTGAAAAASPPVAVP